MLHNDMSVPLQCSNSGDSCQKQVWQLGLPVHVHTPLIKQMTGELLHSACRSTRDVLAAVGTATAAAFCSSNAMQPKMQHVIAEKQFH